MYLALFDVYSIFLPYFCSHFLFIRKRWVLLENRRRQNRVISWRKSLERKSFHQRLHQLVAL